MEQRIQKIIASSGYCSRRQAERLIAEGRVAVNSTVCSIGDLADVQKDTITIDGKPLPKNEERTYIMLNKPRGYITSTKDDKGRPTVLDLIENVGARVFPVGRLDYNSEGLLLMTDDGELANKLMHPSSCIKKTYETRVIGADIERSIKILRQPLLIDGYRINPANVKLINRTDDGALLLITISEGKNRQIRKMCEIAGLKVLKLKRCAEGGLKLGSLPVGKWRYLTEYELEELRKKTQHI